MTFKEAFEAMKHGAKVKLPSWAGYWFWCIPVQSILMHSVSEDNKVFTYPEFTGRRRIYTDVEKITKENIFQVLEEAMLVHMENANNMITLMRYEKGMDEWILCTESDWMCLV